jgi:formylglycine-generating enzyme required for sulfatase activity
MPLIASLQRIVLSLTFVLLIVAVLAPPNVVSRAGALQPTPTQPAPTATVASTPTPMSTPEPTLTFPQAIDRIIAGEKPAETLFTLLAQQPLLLVIGLLLLGLVIYAVIDLSKRWMNRGIDVVDQRIGGARRDIVSEVQREEAKQHIVAAREADRTRRQARTARDRYLDRLEKDMLRLAKIPALGREQRELDLEQVYVPLYVVEREQIESFAQYNLGEFGEMGELRARSGAYEAVQESRPVFRLLSEPNQLPPPAPEPDAVELRLEPLRRPNKTQDKELTTERLLLVGRAGSGKTTTLHYGALMLARATRSGNVTESRKQLQLFTRICLFPVYARLTEVMTFVHARYAQRLDALVGASANLLLEALDELARRDVPELPLGALSDWIRAGGCLVMLDGLDETGDADERGSAMDLIASLVHACPNNRYLVASRPFEGLGERLPNFTERHLRPLDDDDIRRLLNKLFLALRLPEEREATVNGNPDALVPEAAELWRNLERSPRLFDMATNPLLLSSMAVLVEGREPLPVERAKIYEKLVRLTIEAWRKAQLTRDRPGVPVKLFEESDDSVRLRLQLLAADMLEQQRRELTRDQACALLLPIYRENNPDWNNERCSEYIRDLLYQVALHSGLLQARDSDSLFSFTHFTLQEYLAARHYTEQGSAKADNVAALIARRHERRSRETILLAIGHEATSGSRETAQMMLKTLMDADDPDALLLAGDALDEANARTVGELTWQRLAVCERLHAFAFDPPRCPDPKQRNQAATLLDRLDADNRPELDPAHPGYWAERIEPGTFRMGPTPEAFKGQSKQAAFTAHIRRPYALARFLVTNALYKRFIDALDRNGAHEEAKQHRPHFWPGRSYRPGEGNHPVVAVTWYNAMAFAAWLDAELRRQGLLTDGEQIRLPLETEWERAAAYPAAPPPADPTRGRREYPWGAWPQPPVPAVPNDADLLAGLLDAHTQDTNDGMIRAEENVTPGPANTRESGIGAKFVVGIFPDGRAGCGAEEMADNVWEWCANAYRDHPLPDDLAPETLDTQESIVLRGGSSFSGRSRALRGEPRRPP